MFKSTLENHVETAPPQVWSNLETTIGAGAKKLIWKSLFTKVLVGVIGAGVLGVAAVFLLSENKNPQPLKVENTKTDEVELVQNGNSEKLVESANPNVIFMPQPAVSRDKLLVENGEKFSKIELIEIPEEWRSNFDEDAIKVPASDQIVHNGPYSILRNNDGVGEADLAKITNDQVEAIDIAIANLKENSRGDIKSIYNVFSPNSDGKNDSFFIEIDKPVKFDLLIQNSVGDVVFKSNDYKSKWDGKVKGINMPAGKYRVTVVYKFSENEKLETKQEIIELIR